MVDLKQTQFSFLDLETTGGDYNTDRIIEIYVSKILDGKVVDTFHSFFNPGFTPNPFILKLTNISLDDIFSAPNFSEVAEELLSFIEDDIVVAHNARFDYSFLRSEFGALGYQFKNSYCCSVKLSRFLYPRYKRHNLDSIIERFEIPNGDRHRAQYDTEAVKILFYKSLENFGEEKFLEAVNKSIKKASIPEGIMKLDLKTIPETPGVYIFYGEENYPLYVGMSKNLRKRVMSHLYDDITYLKDFKINSQIKDIKIIETAGVLGALLRESALVKSLMPVYNHKLRRNQNLVKLIRSQDENGYYKVEIDKDSGTGIDNLENVVGVFEGTRTLKFMLESYVKKFGLCPKFLGLEKKNGACFSSQLGYCKGACRGLISSDDYNKIFENAFSKHKFQKWENKEPLIIHEESNTKSEDITIDKWCVTDLSEKDEYSQCVISDAFNLDTYKILRSYLANQIS